MELQLHIATYNPMHVKTSFLKTAATMNMTLVGTFQEPSLSGSLSLVQGQLLFPYRPLHIVSGHVHFMPNQLNDPLIEFVAKGRVRSYQITMRCQGSLQSPNLSFESTPPLTQEQIITLLLAGSSEGALSLIMPALIMQQIQNVIFGPEQTQSRLEHYFKSLLAPLRYIRFVPSFADQTARGGIRGAIEVDVNDQLRAVIQKNFSLTEDTKLEVEYALTDDITVRGIRDERGDLGGEVEMRWKF
jgi:translocation and assembly module TamB